MKKLFFLKILMFFSILASCTSDKGGPSNSISFDSEASARKAYTGSSIECSEPNLNCPDYVGGLFILDYNSITDEWQTTACSSTLIANNKILTNHHCIPYDIVESKISCSDRIRIVFPKNNSHEQSSLKCKSIVKSSTLLSSSNERPDWVIIELETPVTRALPKTNITGVPDKELFFSHPVYYTNVDNVLSGQVQKNVCTSNMNHWFSTYYFHNESYIVTAADCSKNVILGNSGSGYFNSQNELSFIGSFSVNDNNTDKPPTHYWFGRPYQLSSKFVGGTNLACINEINPSPSHYCYFNDSIEFAKLLNKLKYTKGSLTTDLQTSINEMISTTDQYIEWTSSTEEFFIETDLLSLFKSFGNELPDTHSLKSNPLPELVAKYLATKASNFVSPQRPHCIKPKAPKSLSVNIPYLSKNFTNFKVKENGELDHALHLRSFSFTLTRTSPESYLGTINVSSESEREEIIKANKEALVKIYTCRFINPTDEVIKDLGNPCEDYNNLVEKQRSWARDHNISDSLLMNETYLHWTKRNGIDFILPICTD